WYYFSNAEMEQNDPPVSLSCLMVSSYEPVQDLAEGRIMALKVASKCSHTIRMLRFFDHFCLALHPLIEILNRF
ncbi:MAG: hypothetical protein V3V31_14565, partial [Methylococcales bacterium]